MYIRWFNFRCILLSNCCYPTSWRTHLEAWSIRYWVAKSTICTYISSGRGCCCQRHGWSWGDARNCNQGRYSSRCHIVRVATQYLIYILLCIKPEFWLVKSYITLRRSCVYKREHIAAENASQPTQRTNGEILPDFILSTGYNASTCYKTDARSLLEPNTTPCTKPTWIQLKRNTSMDLYIDLAQSSKKIIWRGSSKRAKTAGMVAGRPKKRNTLGIAEKEKWAGLTRHGRGSR